MAEQVESPFRFKKFEVFQEGAPMKVGTDGILLGAWVGLDRANRILDIGTGTGVIAIMLGQRTSKALVHGIDIDPEAAKQAEENMAACGWSNRLRSFTGSIQDYVLKSDTQYDLIVSNPPFFSGGTLSEAAERTSVRHTVKLPHGDLLRAVQQLLAEDGTFALILPLIEGLRFEELAQSYQLFCNRKCEVRSRPSKPVERLLLEFGKTQQPQQQEELILQEKTGEDAWTEAYRELCRDFYLDF